ncbi:MAG: radical SAM protein [Candidatus Bathyarchaeota archaeon]|nr:radical SAM protein [Candidatus Bathyarchaeota archaeon]
MTIAQLPEKIRVSVGSAIVLGLMHGKLDAEPTTIYLLTYYSGKCLASCGFCPQAKTSKSRADMLSRVTWPTFPTQEVMSKIETEAKGPAIKRVCIQALNYPRVFNDVFALVKEIRSRADVPLSVSCQPFKLKQMKLLKDVGVDRISIALDAATEDLFDRIKGPLTSSPYEWKTQRETLMKAVQVFGKNRVYTHLIVGLGETEKEIIQTIQWCTDFGVYPSLFAFTPILGTALETLPQPSVATYRRIQLAHYLIVHGKTRCENMKFDEDERLIDYGVSESLLQQVVETGSPFLTSGCPGCNRPYYNERPGGPLYNYPRQPLPEEIRKIKEIRKK